MRGRITALHYIRIRVIHISRRSTQLSRMRHVLDFSTGHVSGQSSAHAYAAD